MKGARLILASGNPGKAREVEAILGPLGVRVLRIGERVPDFDVDEDGDTFEANSIKKALAAYAATGEASLADDSGLCVAALDEGPGVRSARFGGPDLSDRGRLEHLLSALSDVPAPRRAWFHCTLAAALPEAWLKEPSLHARVETLPEDHRLVLAEGRLDGEIGFVPRGDKGFGYDPVFLPTGYDGATLAELDAGEKNRISHRARALSTLYGLLKSTAQ